MDLHDRANFLYSATALEVAARLGLWAGSPEFWEKNEKISPNRGYPGDPIDSHGKDSFRRSSRHGL